MVSAAAMICSVLGNASVPAYAQVTAEAVSDGKPYIIIAEDETVYNEVSEEISDNICEVNPVLEKNDVMIANLTEEEAEALSENDSVFVEEDIILHANAAENYEERIAEKKAKFEKFNRETLDAPDDGDTDPEYEWNIQAINADETDRKLPTDQKVKVAVLDSGVDIVEGMDLAGYVNLVDEEEEISPLFQDLTGHGTAVASVISGNGETGVYGIAPNAGLYSVKVLDGENKAPLSRIIEGIYWCIEHKMNIINMSFGTPAYSKALECAVNDAYDANILMVAAAGNDGDAVEYPAAFENVMAVAATNPAAAISSFSNTGKELEIAAPGEKIHVASFFSGSIVTHGTSIAAPHVTGVAALLWGQDLSRSNEFIRQLIHYSAKDIAGTDECGLLDVGHALEIYDVFSENFNGDTITNGEDIPANTEKPEDFSNIEDDELYVEGRWHRPDHEAAVESNKEGFSDEAIAIIKKGIVFPDEYKIENKPQEGWSGWKPNPWWHGRFAKEDNVTEVNYVAALEMVTTIAIEGGKTSAVSSCSDVLGLKQETYDAIKKHINKLDFASVLAPYANTATNRKYFLYGCGMHIMTDVFAHSTTKLNGKYYGHGYKYGEKTDMIDVFPKRYKMAVRSVKYSMQGLQEGVYSDGTEIGHAIKDYYTDGVEFRIINIKKYLTENCSDHYKSTSTSINIKLGDVDFNK